MTKLSVCTHVWGCPSPGLAPCIWGYTTQPCVVCKLAVADLVSLSVFLMKAVKSTGPRTPLGAYLQLDIDPLTTTLWLHPSSQFIINWIHVTRILRQVCHIKSYQKLYRILATLYQSIFLCQPLPLFHHSEPPGRSGTIYP